MIKFLIRLNLTQSTVGKWQARQGGSGSLKQPCAFALSVGDAWFYKDNTKGSVDAE